MPTKGIIFDCDGTLLDTMDMWHEIEAELARRSGVEPSEELAAELAPLTLPEVAAYFHERHGLGSSNNEVLDMLGEIRAQLPVELKATGLSPPRVRARLRLCRRSQKRACA